MKRLLIILVALVVVSAFIITGCSTTSTPSTTPPATKSQPPATTSAPATAPPSTSKPATTSSPATSTAPAGVITLKFAFDMPKTGAIVPGWEWFASEIQTRSNGKVKVDFYPAAALFNQKDTPDSLKAGVADIANVSLSSHSQEFPINNIFVLAGLEFPDLTRDGFIAKYNAYLQLSQKYTALSDELKDYKLLFWCSNPAYRVISKKKIAVPDDMKGVKLAGSMSQGQVIKLAGGVWVQGVPNDFYEGISKGTFDGAFTSWAQVSVYKFEEVANNFLDYGFTQETQQVCMNLKTWNSLPPDVQKLITDLTLETVGRCADGQISAGQKGIDNVKAKGRTITTPTADQRTAWDKMIAPIADDWVKTAQSKGVNNAADMLKDLRAFEPRP